jgi:opacity protein-like surface antigen
MTPVPMRPRANARRVAVVVALVALVALVAAGPMTAQQAGRFAVEARAGTSVGHVDVSGASLSPSASFAWTIGAMYAVLPALTVHAGYDRSPFTCDEDRGFCAGSSPTFSSQGFTLEARAVLPMFEVLPWLGLGTGLRTFRSETDAGARTSDAALAVVVSGGVELPVGHRLSLAPGLRFATHAHDWGGSHAGGSHAGTERVSVISADIGLRYRF